jgi:hypothetical protein
MKRSPIKRRLRTKHQLANVDHAEYLAWVHTQPCAACGTHQNIQAAHVGQGGMGMKHGTDAEVIPLCGPHDEYSADAIALITGCHIQHDQFLGRWKNMKLGAYREWNELQIAVHRGRFEARNVGTQGECPF